MEAAGSGARGAQRFVVTEAEREVADLLPIEVDPEFARATVRGVPFWFHTFALNRAEGISTPVSRATSATAWRCCPPILPGCACSTSVGSMASTRSSPSVAGPSGCWRSTTSSTGCGSLPAGESSWRAERDFARTIPCCARRSGIGGWTRSRSTVSTSVRCGILHRVENPLGLLRLLRGRTVSGGTVLTETYGLGPEPQDGAAIRVSRPAEVYARDEFVYWSFGDAGLARLALIAGFSEVGPFHCVQVAGHPRIIGRLVA